jgi:hypothetical protein
MSNQEQPQFVRGGPACAFCTRPLSEADASALIKLPSRSLGQRYFGAHAECLRQAMRPEIARFMDLADVPTGLGNIFPPPA